MSVDHVITKRAAGGTLTIAELREFLAEFDGIPAQSFVDRRGVRGVLGTGSLKVKARVNFSGGISEGAAPPAVTIISGLAVCEDHADQAMDTGELWRIIAAIRKERQ